MVYLGASSSAIQSHYDVSNRFYSLWLDRTLTYSCALWEQGDDLEQAQTRKLAYHSEQARVCRGSRVLDIGCGWGGLLRRLTDVYEVEAAVGLTLSSAQRDFVLSFGRPDISVLLENWTEHCPKSPYDAIISIGAFEHFARLGLSRKKKVLAYRNFFKRCHQMLRQRGYLSLQTIIFDACALAEHRLGPYMGMFRGRGIDWMLAQARRKPLFGKMASEAMRLMARFPAEFGPLDVLEFASTFKESTLPCFSEIVDASDQIFEITQVRNDRIDYSETGKAWIGRLLKHKEAAVEIVGASVTERYERYLRLIPAAFESRGLGLLRITLRRV